MYDLTYRPRRLRINPEMRDSIRCQANTTYPLMKL